jgi:hypothetical protein
LLGAILKYVGLGPERENFPQFIGAVGYVTSYTKRLKDGSEHVAITWFKPVRYGGCLTTGSHFSLDRFEVLSGPNIPP